MLDERKQKILSAVIEEFITTAEPVGSKRLVERYGLRISPATVRNELAGLEEMGFLSQPHTSAGRVPSETGYRYYVNGLEKKKTPQVVESTKIRQYYSDLNFEIGQLMSDTSHLLSELTNCASLVWAPDINKEKIKHIDLVGLGGRAVMIVVITSAGSLSKQVVDLGKKIENDTLLEVEKLLNRTLTNVGVEHVGDIAFEMGDLDQEERQLVAKIRFIIEKKLVAGLTQRVDHAGTEHLIEENIISIKRAHEVIDKLERNYQFLEWLQAVTEECNVMVSIGSENEYNLDGFSLVASGYEVEGELVGVLGILGPTRMDYIQVIPTVEYMAKNLSEFLAESQGG